MPIATLARYFHTARHLRPVQVWGRLRFRMTRPRPDLRPAPSLRAAQSAWARCARRASMTGSATLQLLGVERTIAAAADWNRADWPKLWLYHAHYFDDLAATNADSRAVWHRELVSRWIAENPPGHGNGWEPYTLSLRIVNWIKAALGGFPLDDAMRGSLAVQARYLRARLEAHLLGNHLWANAKALVFAGAFFEGDEAAAWREHGLALLRRELAEQVLADGGHFELSPMYHALITEDVLDLVQLARVYPRLVAEEDVGRWREAAARMLHWLRVMSHPDGEIAFFNDAAMEAAPTWSALADYAQAVGIAASIEPLSDLVALRESGYVRLEAGGAALLVDVAKVGPDYLPGHAHADTLSFELSLAGRRVLVNGGTSTYEANAQRLRERGSAMHNTVTVDGADSSEVWASFRVARRARPFDVRWGRGDDGTLWVEAAHDGYLRLPGRVVHRRRWELSTNGLLVTDTVEGRCAEAVARFRFAPGLRTEGSDDVEKSGSGSAADAGASVGVGALASSVNGTPISLRRRCEGGSNVHGAPMSLRWRCEGAGRAVIEQGTWHPCFGASEAIEVLVLPLREVTLGTRFEWE